jgi:hypothetical protein
VALGMGFDFHGFRNPRRLRIALSAGRACRPCRRPIASAVAHLTASTRRRAPP